MMNQRILLRKSNAMVLVMVLWILGLLSAFALSIGVTLRQKIGLVSRLDKRDAVFYTAKAGVEFSRALLANVERPKNAEEEVSFKKLIHNSPVLFQHIPTSEGIAEVSFMNYDNGLSSPVKMFGLDDEQGKLNINKASDEELERLFKLTTGLNEEEAKDLANAIIDWRTVMDQEIVGFYGQEYYQNLNFPYEPKKSDFEVQEEILLVKGMNPDIYDRLKNFITVYGDGRVNLNTASRPVLMALGLSHEIVSLIIDGRNGKDGLPATGDDNIFKDNGISIQVGFLALKPEQLAAIDQVYTNRKISTVSNLFRVNVSAVLSDSQEKRFIVCIIDHASGKIKLWRES